MHIEHHDLQHEFPEMHDAISTLRSANPMFARMYATYHRLTGKVEDLEEHDMPVDDFTIEDMKKHHVKLKDDLYHMMLAFRAGQQSVK